MAKLGEIGSRNCGRLPVACRRLAGGVVDENVDAAKLGDRLSKILR
jgi:hypothetical protein